jgi:hypothetical protein
VPLEDLVEHDPVDESSDAQTEHESGGLAAASGGPYPDAFRLRGGRCGPLQPRTVRSMEQRVSLATLGVRDLALEGHPWEIAHNPRWTTREDGSVELPS